MSQAPPPRKRQKASGPSSTRGKKRRKAKQKPGWRRLLGAMAAGAVVGFGVVWAVTLPPVPKPAARSWPMAQPTPVPAGQNAFAVYRKAAASLDFGAPEGSKAAKERARALGQALHEGEPVGPELAGLTARNQQALAAFAAADRLPDMQVLPPGHTAKTRLPNMIKLQALARVGVLDFQERWRRGDHMGAADRAVEVMAMGRRLASSRHETTIIALVGVVIGDLQLAEINRAAPSLSGVPTPALDRLLHGLNRIDAYETPVEEVAVIAERDLWLREVEQMRERGLPEEQAWLNWASGLMLGKLSEYSRNYHDQLAIQIAARNFGGEAALENRYFKRPLAEAIFSGLIHPGEGLALWSLSMQSINLTGTAEKLLLAEARFDALRVRLASERYRRQHGRLPASLADLAPAHIAAPPSDPFQPDRQLGYAAGKLWSVGWDGKDQGGRLAVDPTLKPVEKRRAQVGDVVLLQRSQIIPIIRQSGPVK